MNNNRNNSIDSMRYIAAFAVVLIHFFPAKGTTKIIVDQLARFAVPFFFIASGYFLGVKAQKNETTSIYTQFAGRILKLYLFWSLLYFLNPDFEKIKQLGILSFYGGVLNNIVDKGFEAIVFLGFAVAPHLWFFVSLILSVLFFSIFKLKRLKTFIVISFVLFLFGNLGKAYIDSPIGVSMLIDTRNFLFFSTFPLALGLYIGSKNIRIENRTAVYLIIAGIILHFSEYMLVKHFYNSNVIYDFVISTPLMGLGVFLYALNNNSFLNSNTLAKLGSLSLGIYGIHMIIGWKLLTILEKFQAIQSYLYIIHPILIFAVATVIILGLKKIKIIKEFV